MLVTVKQDTLFGSGMNAYGESISPSQQGEIAANACVAAAERKGWDSDKAKAFILDYLARHGATAGEVLTDKCSKVYPAHDARAFGAVFKALATARKIKVVGSAKRMKGHGTSGCNVWDLV